MHHPEEISDLQTGYIMKLTEIHSFEDGMQEKPKNNGAFVTNGLKTHINLMERRHSDTVAVRKPGSRRCFSTGTALSQDKENDKSANRSTIYMGFPVGLLRRYSSGNRPIANSILSDDSANRVGRKALTFEQWCFVVKERMKAEKKKKQAMEEKGEQRKTRRTSITFEAWNLTVENRKRLEEQRTMEEKKRDEEQRAEALKNKCKRRLSYEEWLLQKLHKKASECAGRSRISSESIAGLSEGNTGSVLGRADNRATVHLNRQTAAVAPTSTQGSPASHHFESEEKMRRARDAFKKWVIKKELAAMGRERQSLLKSRRVVSTFLQQSSCLTLPEIKNDRIRVAVR